MDGTDSVHDDESTISVPSQYYALQQIQLFRCALYDVSTDAYCQLKHDPWVFSLLSRMDVYIDRKIKIFEIHNLQASFWRKKTIREAVNIVDNSLQPTIDPQNFRATYKILKKNMRVLITALIISSITCVIL